MTPKIEGFYEEKQRRAEEAVSGSGLEEQEAGLSENVEKRKSRMSMWAPARRT